MADDEGSAYTVRVPCTWQGINQTGARLLQTLGKPSRKIK
jgi:hypothetical protein